MSRSRSRSPIPPPMPSPQLLPTPLPSPPALHAKSSRTRLRNSSRPASPSISLRNIGPPLLHRQKTLNLSRSLDLLAEQAKAASRWVDDDFGAAPSSDSGDSGSGIQSARVARPTARPRLISLPPRRPHMPYHSPPPSPTIAAPPPPVPPIPQFALGPTDKKPVLRAPPSPAPVWPAKIISEYTLACAERTASATRRKRVASTPMTCAGFMAMRTSATTRGHARISAL